MKIIRNVAEMQKQSMELKRAGKTIGFTPTMGYLHEGHASLMEQARVESDIVVASIFVNPLQFGANEDFDQYPRDEARDIQLAKEKGVDYLFIPAVSDMYPNPTGIQMLPNQRIAVLCDRSRPGHFQGVLVVLSKLFHLVQPDYAYFGMKDAQQLAIVDLLIKDLNFPIQLRMVPTVREQDGLAKSSRNVNLTSQERAEAPHLYQALQLAETKIVDGEKNPVNIVDEVKQYIKTYTSALIDYVEILSFPNLTAVDWIDQDVIIALAVQYQHVRLIDNIIVNKAGERVHALR